MALTDHDWVQLDGLAMAKLVASGQVTAAELTETALARIARINPSINAVVRSFPERARMDAAQAKSGPFAGVPFLLKEVGPGEKGELLTYASRFFADFRAPVDGTIVARYRDAGLITLGRTSSPELGLCCATEPAIHGVCRSPWRTDRQVGGSSGGGAAAVAARLVPIAQGGDGGGSIRLPAAHCGVYGLKPSRARNPYGPVLGEGWGGFVCAHVMTLSVRDSAAALDATHGPEPGDLYAAPPPSEPYLAAMARDPGRLKVALVTHTAAGAPAHPEVVAAVEATARLMERRGHAIEPFALPFDDEKAHADFWLVLAANTAAAIDARARALGRGPERDELEPITWAFIEEARRVSGAEYAAALQRCHMLCRAIGRVFEGYDLIISPVFAAPPGPIGAFSMQNPSAHAYCEEARLGMPFTWWFNIGGCPAASVPMGWSSEGTPIGVQVAAAFGRDDLVLQVSRQLEEDQPWFGRVPSLAQ
jgi:amidase/6-aminohexanoate-cyclic-dimer hydrolase